MRQFISDVSRLLSFRRGHKLFQKRVRLGGKLGGISRQIRLNPENQLCTDDFAGHLKNNINLAIKATVGIAAYAELAAAAGKIETGGKYRKIAEEFAAEILSFGKKYDHFPITWDTDDDTFPSNTISPSTSF